MPADLDTRSREVYALAGEVLPGAGSGAEGESEVARGVLAASEAGGVLGGFAQAREVFEREVAWLSGVEASGLAHGEIEERLLVNAREVYRLLFQGHLDLRAGEEELLGDVRDADGVRRGNVESQHERPLATVFGEVLVRRMAYRARGHCNLYPADGALNLPREKYSHGLRRLSAIESSRGSFDDALDAVERATGQRVAARQLQQLARSSAVDFDGFYRARKRDACPPGGVIVISCDGKGIVMRPEALRAATKKQAQNSRQKLKTRLSRGEKHGRKRMAEIGAVYETSPVPRTVADILPANEAERAAQIPAAKAKNKWLTASVAENAAAVVADVFDEADRRDPEHQRPWVALVDGNRHQIDRINAEAAAREVPVTIVIDIVHVFEYLWSAGWCFHREGDPAAETWVRRHAQNILAGHATRVAGQIRRQATNAGLDPQQRANADTCAAYLTSKRDYLDYPTALKNGWPIATGIIEGACRHIVKDRLDITGARWGLNGAEAILKLRAIRSNDDFDEYWHYHLTQERLRTHQSRYANNLVPCPG